MSAVPVIIVVVPVEGQATARILSSTYEEELRVALEVWDRATLVQVAVALEQLRQAIADREAAG